MVNLSDDYWFLGQAIAWGIRRDDNLSPDALKEADRKSFDQQFAGTESKLFAALFEGEIPAADGWPKQFAALGFRDGYRENILAAVWSHATSRFSQRELNDLGRRGHRPQKGFVWYPIQQDGQLGGTLQWGSSKWRDVHLRKADVLRLFQTASCDSIASPGPSDDDARAAIREAMAANGGFVGQEIGAKIVRDKFPDFNKKRAMQLVKEATGNAKPGPRGPRNNHAG